MEKPQVMIVDDEKDMVTIISDFLEMSEFKVVGYAYDGNEALSIFDAILPDVVIVDYHLPKQSGSIVLSKIKKSHPNTVVIIISSDRTILSDPELLKHKPDAVIAKPFDVLELIKTMKQLCSTQLLSTNPRD